MIAILVLAVGCGSPGSKDEVSSVPVITNNSEEETTNTAPIDTTEPEEVIEEDVDDLVDYMMATNIANYVVAANTSLPEDVLVISDSSALLRMPDSDEIDELKARGEEDFYTVADDHNYYRYLAMQFLDSVKTKTYHTSARYVKYAMAHGDTLTLDLKDEWALPWNFILFNTVDLPMIGDIIDHETDHSTVFGGGKVFMDEVYYYKETNEFSAPAYYRDRYDAATHQYLKDNLGEEIFSDMEIRRIRLPANLAFKYLNIDGLNEVMIFNEQNEHIVSARYNGAEYYDGLIEGGFRINFIPLSTFDSIDYRTFTYCVSAQARSNVVLGRITESTDDSTLFKLIKKDIGREGRFVWSKDAKFVGGDLSKTYAIFSQSSSTGELSYLHKYDGTNLTRLLNNEAGWAFYRIYPTALQSFNEPVFLIYSGKPETDLTFVQIATFTGSEYELLNTMWLTVE